MKSPTTAPFMTGSILKYILGQFCFHADFNMQYLSDSFVSINYHEINSHENKSTRTDKILIIITSETVSL